MNRRTEIEVSIMLKTLQRQAALVGRKHVMSTNISFNPYAKGGTRVTLEGISYVMVEK